MCMVDMCVWHCNITSHCSQTTRSVPPLDDLTFAVYQDKETAKVIQHLQLRKEEAVQSEQVTSVSPLHMLQYINLYSSVYHFVYSSILPYYCTPEEQFDQAKILKQAIVDLRKVLKVLELLLLSLSTLVQCV